MYDLLFISYWLIVVLLNFKVVINGLSMNNCDKSEFTGILFIYLFSRINYNNMHIFYNLILISTYFIK